MKNKVIVIGLDGVTWKLLRPLIDKNKLPTLKKLMTEGIHGNLKSTIPPVTGPAWVSFATGVQPGKHGIYDFVAPKNNLKDVRTFTSKDIKTETFYEKLNSKGHSCILINLPGSYPPKTKEITITSLLTRENNCIFPKTLLEEIPETKNYRLSPNFSLAKKGKKDNYKDYVNDIRHLEKTRFEIAKKLFHKKEWDFFFLLFSGTDWIQHFLFDKLIDEKLESDHPAFTLYKEIDNYLDYFIKNIPKKCNLIIISDHGFKTYNETFHVNKWLETEGFLKLKSSSKKDVHISKIDEDINKKIKKLRLKIPPSVLKVLLKLKLDRLYWKLKKIIPINVKINLEPDTSKTQAYVTTDLSLGIYINSTKRFKQGIVNEEKYKEIKKEIIEKLKQLKFENKDLFQNVWPSEEIYSGPYSKNAPDIMYLPNICWPAPSTVSSRILYPNIINNHDMNGIFLAYGADIEKNKKLNAEIIDIAPTILHLFDLPISKNIDGKVLDIFKKDSKFAKTKTKYQKSNKKEKKDQSEEKKEDEEAEEKVKERLKALGYLK